MANRRTEKRAFEFQVRATDETDESLVLRGYAAVFNQIAAIGDYFREVIRPGAFSKTIQEAKDIKALRNHNTDVVLASLSGGTLELNEDAHGLYSVMRLDPQNTDARNTYLAVKRGDMDKMSFAFSVVKEQWTKDEAGNRADDLRELLELRLYEVSPVAFPAYEGTQLEADARAAIEARDAADTASREAAATAPDPVRTEEPAGDTAESHSAAVVTPSTRTLRMKLKLQEQED